MASGVHVTFFNLSTKEKRIEIFNDKERGDGATCLAGHPVVPMFSVAERKGNPKISVFTYPAMHKVSCCSLNEGVNGYLSCAFAGTEYLVALSTFPDFKIAMWLWRTGENLIEIETGSQEFDQRISAQLLQISSLSWTQDGRVFLCDIFCNVWLIILGTDERYSILKAAATEITTQKPFVLSYRDGVIVISHDSHAKFYRKPPNAESSSSDSWQCVWTSQAISHPTHLSVHSQRDSILFRSRQGVIYEVTVSFDNVPRSEIISDEGFKYTSLSSVSCRTEIVMATDVDDRLNVLQTSTGNVIARLNLKCHGKVNFIAGHPNLPIVVTCSENGILTFVGLTQASSPEIVGCCHLTNEKLDRVKFSDCGRIVGTLSSDAGRVFIIKTNFHGEEESVFGLLNVERKVVDFFIYEKNDTIKVLILPMGNFNACAGDEVIIYNCTMLKDNCLNEEIVTTVNLLNPFESLHFGSRRNIDVFCVPYLSKQLHRFEFHDDDLRLVDALKSMHRLRKIGISASTREIVTSGFDGFVVVRDGVDVRKIVSSFAAHHRSEGGAKYASVHGEILVSLGRNGDLVATKFRRFDVKNAREDAENYSPRPISMVTKNFDGLFGEQGRATWLENVEAAKKRKGEEEARVVRNSIMSDFERLKGQMRKMLDENKEAPDYARLPISSFDLDHEFRREKMEAAAIEREDVEKDLESRVARQDDIARYLREQFWEPMEVHTADLMSLFGNRRVRNYTLPKLSEEIDDFRLSEQYVFDPSDFSCAEIQNHAEIEEIGDTSDTSLSAICDTREAIFKNDASKDNKLPPAPQTSDVEGGNIQKHTGSSGAQELSVLLGSSAHRWIDDKLSRSLHQLDNNDCVNAKEENISTANTERRLKMHFNDLFREMKAAKGREMLTTGRKIERLRQCEAELKSMFKMEQSTERLESPKWRPSELGESVVRVDDEEILLSARVSPKREDDKNDSVNNETEKNFLSKNGDFYDNTLRRFMDGVLEVRWEDDIKKDVPKPECIVKDSSDYTEEDLRSIEIYRAKVRNLEAERTKYKSMLEKELFETKQALRQIVSAFDNKLKAFALTRIRIDRAILQEKLIRLRAIRTNHSTARRKREIRHFLETELQPASKESRVISDEYSTIEIATSELKNRYDSLMRRDKFLETKFRSEFGDLKQPMVEHLIRHYKKRPRVGILTCTSVTYLTELGRCVVNNERSEILPRECLDFLRGLDNSDVLPASLPAQIDAVHWRTMCKLRRTKIETEMKLRSSAIELAEAESCCSFYQRLSQSIENRLTRLRSHLELLQSSSDEKSTEATDSAEVQLVLKMGQIEVPLSGHTHDFENSIVIDREELVRVNKEIRHAGKRKLAAIQKEIDYRKTILGEEWRHECTIMTLDDLKSELKAIRAVKISKDVRDYLELYPNVPTSEKERETIERNAGAIKKRFSGLIAEEEARLSKITESIERQRRSNEKLAREIEAKKSMNESCLMNSSNWATERAKQEEFEKKKFVAVAKRTRLVRRIEENYEELLTLHARLEVLKLRTYPTLKFQTACKERRALN